MSKSGRPKGESMLCQKLLTRRTLVGSLVALPLAKLPKLALATQWPNKPVRVLFPYSAGSSGDVSARLFALRFSEVFGQPFVVENRAGANGTLAVEAVVRAPADGHTLLWSPSPPITISPAMMTLRYDPVNDLAPISVVHNNTFALIVNSQVPVKTVTEFVRFVRAHPKELTYAEGGIG